MKKKQFNIQIKKISNSIKYFLSAFLILVCTLNSNGQPITRMVGVSPTMDSLWVLDTVNYQVVRSLPPIPNTGGLFTGFNGLAIHPQTGEIYIICKQTGVPNRLLGKLNLLTGGVILIGNMGDNFASITFNANGTLFGVTGDGATVPETVYRINLANAGKTLVHFLGNGADGEVISYCTINNRMYHWSGRAPVVYERFDTSFVVAQNISHSIGDDETSGAVYKGGGKFLISDINSHIGVLDTGGAYVQVGVTPEVLRGLIFITCNRLISGNNFYCSGGSTMLSMSGGSSYQWYKNGAVIGGAVSQTYIASVKGIYNCIVNDACSSDSVTVGINVHESVTDDGNGCTTDACNATTGAVTHLLVNMSDGNFCTTDACNPSTGNISHFPIIVDDSDGCTTDACNPANGNISHIPINVDDSDGCTTDACNPSTGNISHSPVNVDDGDGCTTDACNPANGNISHIPVVTDDGDGCTIDACNPSTGNISHNPINTNDGDGCTTDACNSSTGNISHSPVNVDDGDGCTTDACNPANGNISHISFVTDDGDGCTIDACNPSTGNISHNPINTDDGDGCTTDACNASTGNISHSPVNVDDGDGCTTDACNASTGNISHSPVNVDDGDGCTTDACNPANGNISHIPVVTDDGDGCTIDACNPSTGNISHNPINTDDGDGCTTDVCESSNGNISHTPVNIDDSNMCTIDACDPATGNISHSAININDGNSCTDDFCDPVTAIVTHTPGAGDSPGPIAGTYTVNCLTPGNYNNIAYSIPVISGASYNWAVTSGMVINTGQGTNNLLVNCSGSALNKGINGQVCVIVNTGGCIRSTCTAIELKSMVPATPGAISGPVRVCPGDVINYSVSPTARATSYQWTLPVGLDLNSSPNSNSIYVIVTGLFDNGVVSVKALNVCGGGAARNKTISRNLPGIPSVVTGLKSGICGLSNVSYSTSGAITATSYLWTSPINTTIQSGQGSLSIAVDFGSHYNTGNITVQGINSCGSGAIRSLGVTGKPAMPGLITGLSTVCENSGYPYSVALVNGALSYNWQIPFGATITDQGTNDVDITFGAAGSGINISVKALNACGTSALRIKNGITISTCTRSESNSFINNCYVYPNPAYEELNLSMTADKAEAMLLALIDVTGRTILSENRSVTEGFQTYQLNVNGVSKGVYLLMVEIGNRRGVIKIALE